jgi:hypothetical protein
MSRNDRRTPPQSAWLATLSTDPARHPWLPYTAFKLGVGETTGRTNSQHQEEAMTTPTTTLAQAAALLDAVARGSEHAVDYEVPLRCGQAANGLYPLLGHTLTDVPLVADDADEIAAAVTEAITLLSSLPHDALPDPVLDALLEARTARDIAQRSVVR